MSFSISLYRNLYFSDDKVNYQKFTGRKSITYTGKIFTDIKELPKDFDNKKDFYFNCDCYYKEYGKFYKIKI